MSKKVQHERDASENNFKTALKKFHDTQRDGKTFITDSPDARSQGSKTHSNFFAGRNNMFRSTFMAHDNQIQNEL